MQMLLIFLLGMIFYAVAMPIIEQIASLVVTFIELGKAKLSLKITKINVDIENCANEVQGNDILEPCIGFDTTPYYEEYYDEEDDF